MKFDVVIGNPPYNKGMDLDFVDLGYKISNKYTVMITPAKWQTTADDYSGCASKNINYKQFREMYVPHMSYVCFYPQSMEVFDIYQIDGITWFIIDKNTHDSCEVINKCRVQEYYNSSIMRPLLGRESLLNIGSEIGDSLHQYKHFVFRQYASNKYQVWTNNQVAGSGSRFMSDNGSSTVIGLSRILDTSKGEKSPSGASECIFSSDNRAECESFISWLNTKFTRFFVACNISKLTGILTNDYFRFVPAPPSGKFDHIYTDQELYEAFNLPQKYIDIIESVIKERK